MNITLNNLIDDIMLSLRNNNISESENINRKQIELWILQYRSLLLRQEIDKGNNINDLAYQTIMLNLEPDEYLQYNTLGVYRLKSTNSIPSVINIGSTIEVSSVFDESGNEIQLMSKGRSNMQSQRKYTSRDYTAYLEGNKLCLNGDILLDRVEFRSIFENPADVEGFTSDDPYPIPYGFIPTLRALILDKEFRIGRPTDNINNQNNDIENLNEKN